MRKQFVKTVEALLKKDERTALILGDIGVWGFREAFKQYPERVYNIGILEQSTISMAAGLAMNNVIPIVHTIAPFLVERSYEQLKLDFGYQQLGGNFVSVGASYDYAVLGCSHHCPGDTSVLKLIPNMEIVVPGTAEEFDSLFNQAYADGHPTYFRLSEQTNSQSHSVTFGKGILIKKGRQATVIAVGSLLDKVMAACDGLDVTVLYYTTLAPFDSQLVRRHCSSGKLLLCEPYYAGALLYDVITALKGRACTIDFVGLPHSFFTNYGSLDQHDEAAGLTIKNIKKKLKKLIHE